MTATVPDETVSCLCLDFPKMIRDAENGFKTQDMMICSRFQYTNCTIMNYAPNILKTHSSQIQKQKTDSFEMQYQHYLMFQIHHQRLHQLDL